jgi:SAM-dependent methyltransferase
MVEVVALHRWTWKGIIARAAEVLRQEGWRSFSGASLHTDTTLSCDRALQKFESFPHYRDTFLGVLKRQAYLDLIRRWGGAPERGRVLKTDLFEEAVGLDAFLPDLQRDKNAVYGIDISPAVVQRAISKGARRAADCAAADVRRLPFADRSFVLVVSPSTLDHFSEPRDLGVSLRELLRVLEPHGRLIVTVDNRQNLFDPLLRILGRLGWTPYYLGSSYRIEELCAELVAAGFAVEETTAILHNPRLVAFALVALATKTGWAPLITCVQRLLVAAQRLEHTSLCYYTGSFVAVKARPSSA